MNGADRPSEEPAYRSRISRRTTLQWLASAAATSGLLPYGLAAAQKSAASFASKGYGTDPDLNDPTVPWRRTMTAHQLQMTAVLADLILPGTASAPAPSAIGIHEFVDEWVSAPYPEQQADRITIFEGLERLDSEARRRWQRGFLEAHAEQQEQLIEAIASESTSANASPRNAFFRRFRYVILGAYYTTPEGFRDIGYVGNVPLATYPPVTEKEREILEEELRRLGIKLT